MTIHALNRPLVFGDHEQIAVIRAMESGALACPGCGRVFSAGFDHDLGDSPHRVNCPGCGKNFSTPDEWRRFHRERFAAEAVT